MKPPKLVVVIRDGLLDAVISTKPVEALVVDMDIECADRDSLFYYERLPRLRLATVAEVETRTNESEVYRIAEAHREIFDKQMASTGQDQQQEGTAG